jgi:MioC protein
LAQPITILVGTMTGTAELVAQEVEQTLQAAGYAPCIEMMDTADAGIFAGGGVFLVVSSTYGNGDVPDNAQALYASLETARPDLSTVTYGVVALGDVTYKATFCEGGLRFDRLLTELGARRAGEPLRHDASSGTLAEDVACEWAATWAETELAPAAAA